MMKNEINFIVSIVAFILLIIQIILFKSWIKRKKNNNESQNIEWSDLSSIVKSVAVILMLMLTSTFFFLKFLNEY